MSKLKAIQNHIVFQFVDNVKQGMFEQVTDWGFVQTTFYDDSAKQCRWGTIVSVGPKCTHEELQPGTQILIEALKWTEGVEFEGQKYWRTDETHVLATR